VLFSGLSAITFLLLLVLFWRHNQFAHKRRYSQWERSFLPTLWHFNGAGIGFPQRSCKAEARCVPKILPSGQLGPVPTPTRRRIKKTLSKGLRSHSGWRGFTTPARTAGSRNRLGFLWLVVKRLVANAIIRRSVASVLRSKFRRLGAHAELLKNHTLRAFPGGLKPTLSRQGSITLRVGSFFVSLPSPHEEWRENNRMVSLTTPYVLDKVFVNRGQR